LTAASQIEDAVVGSCNGTDVTLNNGTDTNASINGTGSNDINGTDSAGANNGTDSSNGGESSSNKITVETSSKKGSGSAASGAGKVWLFHGQPPPSDIVLTLLVP
jgi:hypothetical protein